MDKLAAAALLLAAATAAAAQAPQTEEDKTLYAMGLLVGRSLKDYDLTSREVDLLKRGLGDALAGKKPAVEIAAYEQKVRELMEKRRATSTEKQKLAAKGYLEAAAKEKGAVKTESGLVYLSLKEGSGESPKATDTVRVNYEGRLTDGTVFDASARHGGPAEFPVNKVIPCWTEGVQKMKPGGKAKLVCPSAIAYGDHGIPQAGIGGGATLVFDVELLEVKK
jgi:FKBP-type peptidyl-prolyl cis-trans isomerase FkpA